jgi:hypothetical protein
MTDLLARLRDTDTTRRIGESYADTHERRQRDRNEAAAEIERLKKEALFTAITVLPDKDAEIERLRADLAHADAKGQENDKLLWGTIKANERMRAALREIDQARYTGRNTISPDNAFQHAISLNEKLIAVMDIARAALAEEKKDDR